MKSRMLRWNWGGGTKKLVQIFGKETSYKATLSKMEK